MLLQDLLKELDSLNLPKDQYAITSSAAMAVRGIPREVRDLDIIVSGGLWDVLAKKYNVITEPFLRIKLTDNIEALGPNSYFVDPSIALPEEQLVGAEVIDGRPYVDLRILRKAKVLGTREKDKVDVALLDEYLRSQGL